MSVDPNESLETLDRKIDLNFDVSLIINLFIWNAPKVANASQGCGLGGCILQPKQRQYVRADNTAIKATKPPASCPPTDCRSADQTARVEHEISAVSKDTNTGS
mmetsp:Transcript_23593/g.49361  ORF Transcript_23593/g.49361 Transcript_23593/m.49361 type:complete len:104 (-) Transcript_23593:446-757(-)